MHGKINDTGADPPMLAAALSYAACGWYVFPAHKSGEKRSHKSGAKTPSKLPWGMSVDSEEIRADFATFKGCNVAIVTGEVSGLFVLECDTKAGHDVDGAASLTGWEKANGELPPTLMAISPTGSVHRYFSHPGPGIKVWNSNNTVGPGVDCKGDGGMVIAPPSVRPDKIDKPGGVYRWLNEGQPIADAPQALLAIVCNQSTKGSSEAPEPREAPKPDNEWSDFSDRYNESSRGASSGRWRLFNNKLLQILPVWFPLLYSPDGARPYQTGYRVTSKWLGRDLQEDLSALPFGIYDFGLEKGFTPIDLVMARMQVDFTKAVAWLSGTAGIVVDEDDGIGEDDEDSEGGSDDDDDDAVDDKGDASRDNRWSNAEERDANEAPVANKLPVIQITPRISVLTSAAQTMLINAKVPFYQRGGELVRPIIRTVKAAHGHLTKTAQLRAITPIYMRDTICRHSIWKRYDKRANKWNRATPPLNVAETLLARDGIWAFPEIAGVIATPTMRPDGTLLTKQGYDPTTRLLLIEPPKMPPIPDNPTRQDALEALALLTDLIRESPFVDGVAKSVALSGLITPVVRAAFPVAPLHASSAPVAGTGKSFLWDLAAAISSGQRRIPVIAASNDEETEKRLVGVMLSGQPLISIDNLNGELKGDFLCQAVEQHFLDIRPLGRSVIARIETGGVTIFASGNNISIVGDLCRRTIKSRLNAKMENPQLRQYEGDPISKILEDRGRYIAACLTICRAYIVAGRPSLAPRLASFQGWSDTVRSALIWLGEDDPVKSMESQRAEDPQRVALSDVVRAWSQIIGIGFERRVTLAHATAKAAERDYGDLRHPKFHAALLAAMSMIKGGNSYGSNIDMTTLGRWFKMNKERIVDGHCLMNQSNEKGVATWWVEAA
ncbi:bifunctional DNA primase/polymerase [Bradyrhizobium sp. JYMT SZCCT0428]|uniref:bifunctional DNA primase/polymerase n=1 Tax=Bradyrhizobium sp. JYMT SZCCT0428 TaxID=2807673 RepID=UPI001BAD7C54|nr:bifunctional DNA primase/polymerase [Bradyrhizobium sp. JYMT SZCCT0428]MBR1151556.1 bifunctional DNA primase/polymerase [Bradyrhizobium sp. JYMT SZCCT0428]